MENKDFTKNIIQEGLNLVKKPKIELRTEKLNRLTNAIKNDIRCDVSYDFRGAIWNNGSIFTINDSVRNGTVLLIDLQFNLNKGPESIRLKFGVWRQSFMSTANANELIIEYYNKVQMYVKISEYIAEHYYIYQDNYRDVKRGAKSNHEN
jgi:hypothetical protein